MNKFRMLKWVLGTASFALMAIGAGHYAPLRGLLRFGPSCPVGGDIDSTPAQREATRHEAISLKKGTHPAPGRVAFGFELGKTDAAQIEHFVKTAGVNCQFDHSKMVRECDFASLAHFGVVAPGTVFFRSDDKGQLVALLVTAKMTLEKAQATESAWNSNLAHTLGPAQASEGRATEALLSQSRQEHRFSDLFASVTTTQMGDGVRVNLELQSL